MKSYQAHEPGEPLQEVESPTRANESGPPPIPQVTSVATSSGRTLPHGRLVVDLEKYQGH